VDIMTPRCSAFRPTVYAENG